MDTANPLILGLIAGGAIFLGLPVARLRNPAPRLRMFLGTFAAGVLVFLLVDILASALGPVEAAAERLDGAHGSLASAVGWTLLLLGPFALGYLGLVAYNLMLSTRKKPAEGETAGPEHGWFHLLRPSHQTALLIAIGIGLHNFSEGLAIGQSAASGAIALSTVLVVGFGLHNATEGFGISAPMAAATERPSWGYLLALGVVGGGPTVLGAALGGSFTSEIASVAFLSLAGGSILYVVIQLVAVGLRQAWPMLMASGIFAGLSVGFVTDLVLVAAGA